MQDKERLAAHIRGQESVVQGLRAERKLWGQELAQQGKVCYKEPSRTDIKFICPFEYWKISSWNSSR